MTRRGPVEPERLVPTPTCARTASPLKLDSNTEHLSFNSLFQDEISCITRGVPPGPASQSMR